MIEKREYINLEKNEDCSKLTDEVYLKEKEKMKSKFYSEFKKSNLYIERDFIDKKIDEESLNTILNINLKSIIEKRKRNSKCIYENLNNKNINYLINDYNENNDCLLYVPIYMDKNFKNKLQEFLISQKFYCPNHWEIDTKINSLFENEFSLVCDQRYSEEQIKYNIELINKFKI